MTEIARYHGTPVVKAPVWTWEVPAYFFVGGLGGMAAVVALAAHASGAVGVTRDALGLAVGAALVSPALLVSDLGRPLRFANMLRVWKPRSAMSLGAWTLAAFGPAAVGALGLTALGAPPLAQTLGLALAAGLGAVLATYTGVLLGATVLPVWAEHRATLPVHFGVAGLGSAAAALELLGHGGPLATLGVVCAVVETGLAVRSEIEPAGPENAPLREGQSGSWVRTSAVLLGPVPLACRALGLGPLAAVSFLAGSLLGRFGWIEAGRSFAAGSARS